MVHFYFHIPVIVIKKIHWDHHLVLRSDYGNTKCNAVQQDWVNDLKICWAVAASLFKVKVRSEVEMRLCNLRLSQGHCKELSQDFVSLKLTSLKTRWLSNAVIFYFLFQMFKITTHENNIDFDFWKFWLCLPVRL